MICQTHQPSSLGHVDVFWVYNVFQDVYFAFCHLLDVCQTIRKASLQDVGCFFQPEKRCKE